MNFQEKAGKRIVKLKIKNLTPRQVSLKLGVSSNKEVKEIKRVLDALVDDALLIVDAGGRYSDISFKSITLNAKYTRANTPPAKRNAVHAPDLSGCEENIVDIPAGTLNIESGELTAPGGKKARAYIGALRGNKRGFAFLVSDDKETADLFIPNSELHGAQHGDRVAAVIVKGDSASVICILERGNSRIIGTFMKRPQDNYGFVVPDGNSHFSDIFVGAKSSSGAKDGDKVVAYITNYKGSKLEGKITEVIGASGERDTTVLSILKSYEFENVFRDDALNEAEKLASMPVRAENRTDYRNLTTITIDGDDSKDFDDAISIERTERGYRLYVHIADVSEYVRPNGAIDKEAFERCTSVYFPGSVYPMLPEALSDDLCSLKENEDRLALTCVMDIDKSGAVTERKIVESVIRSDRRMTYADVTKILEGDNVLLNKYSDIAGMLQDAERLAEILSKRRISRGKIDLVSRECKIILDDKGEVQDIVEYPYTISNGIIEEFMLIANETVAEFAVRNELPFVYRVHERPDKDKMKALRFFLEGVGLSLPPGDVTPDDIRRMLGKIVGHELEGVVNRVVLRSMQKAKYMTECKGHFGLATGYYCHFTSPIRRYPDLQIHRVLKTYLKGGQEIKAKHIAAKCAETATRSSEREVAAERAERDIDDFYKAEYMARHIGEEFEGVISGVTSFGIFVELKNTCEGIIKLDGLPKDNYNYIESQFMLKGAKHEYTLGGRIRIIVDEVDFGSSRVAFRQAE